MHRIVYLQRATLDPRVVVRKPSFLHDWVEYPGTPTGQMVERLQGATIAISNKVRLPREVIDAVPSLKLVAIGATGTDSVDLDACRAHDIRVVNVREYAKHSVSEHALSLMLAISRNLMRYRDALAGGAWQRASQFYLGDFPINDLAGKTLAILGRGVLGEATARLGLAFGMKVVYAERKGVTRARDGYWPFEEALAAADFFSLHCPVTPETVGLIGEPELRRMKPSAILVNTARGGLVQEAVLIRALREGWIAGAAVDVVSEEPPRNGNLLVDTPLPNLIVTPHIAWASAEAKQRLADELIDAIEAWERGAPINVVV